MILQNAKKIKVFCSYTKKIHNDHWLYAWKKVNRCTSEISGSTIPSLIEYCKYWLNIQRKKKQYTANTSFIHNMVGNL